MADIKSYRQENALLNKVTGFAPSPRTAIGNMFVGGQVGYGADLTKMDSATTLVFNPCIPIVIQTPTMWKSTPKRQQMLKALIETHAHSITGTDFSYTTETASAMQGHDGQEAKVPTRTTRSAVNPQFLMNEIPGNAISNFFQYWQWDMQHPDTNASILAAEYGGADNIPPWVYSTFSMSMLMIIPDPLMIPDRMIDCALYTNMFPTESGEIGFERVINQSQTKERSISMTGIVQHNVNTWELGYQILSLLQLHKINYNYARPGLAGVTAAQEAVDQAISEFGLYEQAMMDTGQAKRFFPTQAGTEDVSNLFTGVDQRQTQNAPMDQGTKDMSFAGTAAAQTTNQA